MTRSRRVMLAAAGLALALSAGATGVADVVVDPPGPIEVISVPPFGIASGAVTLDNGSNPVVELTALERDACALEVTATPAPDDLPASLGTQTVTTTCDYRGSAGSAGSGSGSGDGAGGSGSGTGFALRRCEVHALSNVSTLASFTVLCEPVGDFELATSTGELDFGTVAIDGGATMQVTVTNGSAGSAAQLSLQIGDQAGNFQLDAPCTDDVIGCDAPVDLPPLATATIDVSCTPTATGALVAQLLIVADNGGVAEPVTLTCTGVTSTANPQITLDTTALDVGGVEVGTGSAIATVHVANTGGQPLAISSFTPVGGAGSGDWTVIATPPCDVGSCTLLAGSSTDVTATFHPSALDARDTTLQIESNDPVRPTSSVALAGTGLGAELALVTPVGSAGVDLGGVPVGGTSAFQLVLQNAGNQDLTGVTATVAPAGTYTLAPAAPVVPQSGEATLTITCTPTAVATLPATLTISAPAALTGSPIAVPLTCAGVAGTMAATPNPIQLGEIRTSGSGAQQKITLSDLGSAAAVTVDDPVLDTGSDSVGSANLTLGPLSSHQITPAEPATFTLTVAPLVAGPIVDRIAVTAGSGTIEIPITGTVVTAAVSAPTNVVIGNFCVDQPTTPTNVTLTGSGTATVLLDAPALGSGAASPFQLAAVSPSSYPFELLPLGSATVSVTPNRSATATEVSDSILWATDAPDPQPTTNLVAMFIDVGGAISPAAIDYGDSPIHLAVGNDQIVTIQNCGATTMMLDAPTITPTGAFHVDGTPLPASLAPAQLATLKVGFAPIEQGVFDAVLSVSSSEGDLQVMLHGQGVVAAGSGGSGGSGGGDGGGGGCGCHGAEPPSSWLLVATGLAFVVLRRRRFGLRST